MSEITAVGPRLGIFGPPPVPPSRSLIATAGVLVEGEEGDRWLNGVVMQPYPTPEEADAWNPCSEDTKTGGENPDQATWDPVAIFLEATCTTAFADGLEERVVRSLEAVTPKKVEQVLVGLITPGVGANTNPVLSDSNNQILLGGVGVSPREAVAEIEDQIADQYGAQGLIVATPGTVDMLSSILEEDNEGTIYTQAGTPVVSAQGVVGANPSGGGTAGDGQAWVWGIGPVQVRMTEITTFPRVSTLDRSINEYEIIAERYVLVTFVGPQLAVLADWAIASS